MLTINGHEILLSRGPRKNGMYNIEWHQGQENLADYFTKHFNGNHHRRV
jgi:hypothetical protein